MKKTASGIIFICALAVTVAAIALLLLPKAASIVCGVVTICLSLMDGLVSPNLSSALGLLGGNLTLVLPSHIWCGILAVSGGCTTLLSGIFWLVLDKKTEEKEVS